MAFIVHDLAIGVVQGTKVEGTIAKLFEGKMQNFVECVNVPYKSTRQEVYADLQLLVKGCKNMYDSFDKYVEVEDLTGQNQYMAEGHGMQVPPTSSSPVCFHWDSATSSLRPCCNP